MLHYVDMKLLCGTLRLCCATLDTMLVCGTLQSVLFYTRYDAGGVALSRLCCAALDMILGVWHSSDSAVLH